MFEFSINILWKHIIGPHISLCSWEYHTWGESSGTVNETRIVEIRSGEVAVRD